uniref:Reverse transcriptase domain-containing protein n=1 Tax=Tanacetum cinerariifolium TaxID=118510 RepID=A0A699KCV8_TANCI|nr:reverse transcriptase domain-containing protein [Tanacetum cinerariifolium]
MNQVLCQGTTVEKNANNKRKFENQPKDNCVPQQLPFKKPNVERAYTIRANERKAYAGNLPYCNKCKLHHVGQCIVKCSNCKRVGHMNRDCKTSVAAMIQSAHVANPKATTTCHECGRLGHFRDKCQKLRNQNQKPDVERAYTIRANERKAYAGNLPYCNKCKLHHVGPCIVKCSNCKRVGHMNRDCKTSIAAMIQSAHVANPNATTTCHECGRLGHFRDKCQKLRNQNQVNKI